MRSHPFLKIFLWLGAAFLVLYGVSWIPTFDRGGVSWGVTFSQYYATENLRLDWRTVYLAMLDELKPKQLRLIAYWQYLEPSRGEFRFDDLDWQVAEAAKRGITITLAVGQKVPRWPECHWPGWVREETSDRFAPDLFSYLRAVVEHYRGEKAIVRWQVENEPLFRLFGVCPSPDPALLDREVALVHEVDATRPVMLTDAGELSTWRGIEGRSEILGTTLYRTVWNQYTGWWTHIWPPSWYTFRAWVATHLKGTEEVVISELQAEPWASGNRDLITIPFDEQTERFNVEEFDRTVAFARATGISEITLWGAEWWYWRKEHGDPSFWEQGKRILGGD